MNDSAMSDYIFRIRNLRVAYNGELVLHVPSLDIKRGEVVFLLGNSGSGKSTFLETLGLMNNFSSPHSQIVLYPEPTHKGIDYRSLWGDEERLAAFRRTYFTFMFQETQLFPQFSIPENVALPHIIRNTRVETALREAEERLAALEIEHRKHHHISQISGGERQRVAFARAVLVGPRILFADEPTGNLGAEDSKRVMHHIRGFVQSGDQQSTAIVVTHNIDLALEYGDRIVVIQDNHAVFPSNVFLVTERSYEKTKEVLRIAIDRNQEILKETAKPDIMVSSEEVPTIHVPDHSFRTFFGPRSTEELSMKRRINWILLGILLLAILAIGFSAGGRLVLKEKMEDPFVKWISVDVPYGRQSDVPKILNAFGSDSAKRKYDIQSINAFERYPTNVYDKRTNQIHDAYGRTIEIHDPILKVLEEPHLWIKGKSFSDSTDIGLIVTEEFLNFCGVKMDEGFVYLSMSTNSQDTVDVPVPIPVRAIVRALPGRSQFLSTEYFANQRNQDPSAPFNPASARDLIIFCPGKMDNALVLKDSLERYLASNDSLMNPYFVIDSLPSNHRSWVEGFIVKVSFLPGIPWKWLEPTFRLFTLRCSFPFKPVLLYSYPSSPLYSGILHQTANRISINVAMLEHVSALREDLLVDPYGLEIDLARVESLNNYRVVTNLTGILSMVIIGISIISVCIYMGYVLYMHLFKNRVHLGMLKAFGLSPRTLEKMYLERMLISLFLSVTVASMLAVATGYSGLLRSVIGMLGFPVELKYLYFDLLNPYPFVFLFALFSLSLVSLKLTAKQILRRSPGDLIYDRIDSNFGNETKPIE
jgi:ABC-type lipoprotein export system ATPase subunit